MPEHDAASRAPDCLQSASRADSARDRRGFGRRAGARSCFARSWSSRRPGAFGGSLETMSDFADGPAEMATRRGADVGGAGDRPHRPLRDAGSAETGGVADVMEAAALRSGRITLREGLSAAAVSAASIGVGASVGREGPVVHLGAMLSSFIATRLRLSRSQAVTLLGCGVAAAVAASFNAPIAGVFFCARGGGRSLCAERVRADRDRKRGRHHDLPAILRGLSGVHRSRPVHRLLLGISRVRAAGRSLRSDGDHSSPFDRIRGGGCGQVASARLGATHGGRVVRRRYRARLSAGAGRGLRGHRRGASGDSTSSPS